VDGQWCVRFITYLPTYLPTYLERNQDDIFWPPRETGNPAIEGGKSPPVAPGKCQQVRVGDLPVGDNPLHPSRAAHQRHIIHEKYVTVELADALEQSHSL
jgi:hypothetical protein